MKSKEPQDPSADSETGAEPTEARSYSDTELRAVFLGLEHSQRRRTLDFAASISSFQEAHNAGNENAVLWAVAYAAAKGERIPQWAEKVFLERFFRVIGQQAESWDQVFGKPHPPRTNFKAIRKRHKLLWPVFKRVEELRNENIPIDKALQQVAEENCISSSTARDYYYEMLKRLRDIS